MQRAVRVLCDDMKRQLSGSLQCDINVLLVSPPV